MSKTREELLKELEQIDDVYNEAQDALTKEQKRIEDSLEPFIIRKNRAWDKKEIICKEIDNWYRNNHGEHCKKGLEFICDDCYAKFEKWEKEN